MAITVKHNKVSTIPDTDDTSLVRPSDWNADHTLVGTIDVANGGTGASTLTGYVKGNGTSAMTAVATVPSTDITGLGTMSTQNANAVAITGGTVNGTSVGATTASTGRFSDLTDTGLTSGRVVYASTGGNLVDASNFTYDGTNLVAGAIQNTPIGATTPSTVNATTITGQTGVLRGTGSNLLLQSQTFTSGSWSKSNTTVTASATTAPDSTNTASKLVATVTSGQHGVNQTVTLTTALCTFSFYAKASEYTNIRIDMTDAATGDVFCDANLSAGTIGAVTSGGSWTNSSATITSVGNGWYRLTLTSLRGAGSNPIPVIYLLNNAGSNSFAGNGTDGVFVWGSQIEFGSTANTYIPTTTTAVYGTPTLSFSGVSTIGLESTGALYLQPAGTGAIQAQATTSTTAGGNARGANAVDWQTIRDVASRVAAGQYSVVSGGISNTANAVNSNIGGGQSNLVSSNGYSSGIFSGLSNQSTGFYSPVVGGQSNTAGGFYNFIGGGFTNSGTASAAVTTQSGTMNATTAVTLSGSNANIKVGQYISGTSIANDTYVAAISGTSLTLSKVASGSSTSTLSFFTPHGVVVGGGNNQATGSYSFIGGGGDAGTAANRNVASGDWSTVGGGQQNTASGIGSVVAGGGTFGSGGSGNTASGVGSAILGGWGNTASGTGSSVISGNNNTSNASRTTVLGSLATARAINGIFSMQPCNSPISASGGINQTSILVLARQTTDATATALASDSSAAGTTNQVILPNNSAYFFTGEVVSGVTGGGNTKGWTIEGVIKRGANAASTTLVGVTVMSSYADVGAATWTIAVTADTTNGGLRVTFTGQASTTIRTVCQIRTTEMTY